MRRTHKRFGQLGLDFRNHALTQILRAADTYVKVRDYIEPKLTGTNKLTGTHACRAQRYEHRLEQTISVSSDALPFQLQILANGSPEPLVFCRKVTRCIAMFQAKGGQCLCRVIHGSNDNRAAVYLIIAAQSPRALSDLI